MESLKLSEYMHFLFKLIFLFCLASGYGIQCRPSSLDDEPSTCRMEKRSFQMISMIFYAGSQIIRIDWRTEELESLVACSFILAGVLLQLSYLTGEIFAIPLALKLLYDCVVMWKKPEEAKKND